MVAHPIVRFAGIPARAAALGLGLLLSLPGRAPAAEPPILLVTSQLDHTVKAYDGSTGAFLRNAATGVGDPLDALIGADGNLLVTDGHANAIRRFDWATGQPLGNFASAVSPLGMTISGGKVYVCQTNPPQIVRSFDAVTGADAGSFEPTVGNGNPAPRDVKVGHGRLYVSYWNLGTVEMFDLETHASLGLLFLAGTGGLATPAALAFGPDGNLYVSYAYYVNRYHPTTGEFLGRFVDTGDRSGLRAAFGIAWGPDGNLYVATQNTPGVQRYDGSTGAFIDDFVPAGSGGLTAPFHISFTPFNQAPTCGAARASVARLWPPDRRLVPVEIQGVSDPEGDAVTIAVTGVTQDEALLAPPAQGGSGRDPCPDAVLGSGGTVQLRAERAGNGHGRVYTIAFTASDANGGTCDGTVQVCVPRDEHDPTCIESGRQFDSLGPCAPPRGPGGLEITVTPPRSGRPATVAYVLPEAGPLSIAVYDVAGRRRLTLAEGPSEAGPHELTWDASALPPGTYFCRLRAGAATATRSVRVGR